jgi:hypothetical protein
MVIECPYLWDEFGRSSIMGRRSAPIDALSIIERKLSFVVLFQSPSRLSSSSPVSSEFIKTPSSSSFSMGLKKKVVVLFYLSTFMGY